MDGGSRPGRHGADDGPSPRGRSLVLRLRQLAGRRPGAASRRRPQRRARLRGTGGGHPRDSRSSGLRPRDATGPGRDGTARRDPRVDLRAGFEGGVAPAEPLDILQRGLGRGVCQVAGGDQRGPQAELVRGRRRRLRAAQYTQFLLHKPHDHEPGLALDATPLGARETEDQRE